MVDFLKNKLHLTINSKNDIIVKARHGIHFLGADILPKGRRLKNRNVARIRSRMNLQNVSSYWGLGRGHGTDKLKREIDWRIIKNLEDIYNIN